MTEVGKGLSLTMAQIGDQMSAPMTINEIKVHGATNTRTTFLEPIFRPLVGDAQNSGSTIGDVIGKLRVASAKLDGLRRFKSRTATILPWKLTSK